MHHCLKKPCVRLQKFPQRDLCSLAILLRSFVNSTAFPQETLHWLVFSQKCISFPHLIFEITKLLHCLTKHCIARKTSTFTRKSTTIPQETLQCSHNDSVPPINFAFARQTFSLSSKTFAFSRQVLKYSSRSYRIFPSQIHCEQTQSLFVFNITPAFHFHFHNEKMYG